MIPFEKEASLTETEEAARELLNAEWDNVIRTSPAILEDFQEKFPKACELVNQKVRNSGVENLGNVFRPGVPDFLGFDDDGDYCFIEVKGENDGLRHSQLKWLRDFQDLNMEIWFTDSNEKITETLEGENLEAYSLSPKRSSGEAEVLERQNNFLNVQMPATLAAIIGLETGDKVAWKIKNKNELILDTR